MTYCIQMFNGKDSLNAGKDTKTSDYTSLKFFAEYAEKNGEVATALGYHKDRVSRYGENLSVWFDLGTFSRRHGMNSAAEECFKEILARDDKHFQCLIAYGALCAEHEQLEKARVLLHSAATHYPDNVLPKTVLALLYDVMGEDAESESFASQAKEAASCQQTKESIFLSAAKFLLECHAGQLTERAIIEEMILSGATVNSYLMMAQLEQQRGSFDLALENIHKAFKLKQDDPSVWSSLGMLLLLDTCL